MNLDQPQLVLDLLGHAGKLLSDAHRAASEDGMTGSIRDFLFGLNSALDALVDLITEDTEVR